MGNHHIIGDAFYNYGYVEGSGPNKEHNNIIGGGPKHNDMNPDERDAASKQLGNKTLNLGGGVSGRRQRRQKNVDGNGPTGAENSDFEPFTNCYC